MAKETCSLCNGKKGTQESWGTHGKGWYPCSRCKGKGYIIVPDPPRQKKELTSNRAQHEPRTNRERHPQQDRPQQTSQWLEKPCKGCGKPLRYKANWDHIPNYHKECRSSIPSFHIRSWENQRGDTGKVLSNDDDPNTSTHIHHHKDGTTISTYNGSKPVGRFNFDTGEDETPKK